MADENSGEHAAVAEIIADAATEIVAETNAATDEGERVRDALIEAQLADIHAQRLAEMEARFSERFDAFTRNMSAWFERIAQCETKILTMQETMMVRETAPPLLIQAPSNPSSADLDAPVLVVTEAVEDAPAEKAEVSTPKKKLRHLV